MNLKQYRFVTEYLKWGDAALAYKNAYNCKSDNYRAIESAANRLLNTHEIAEAIEEAEARLRAEAEATVKAKLTSELLTIQRKREILARIAEGNIYIEQQYKGRDCKTCTQMVKPSINQMLKAIDLDSRLAGDYPTPKQMTVVHTVQPANASPATSKQTEATADMQHSKEKHHISHAGLRKLLSTPVRQQKEVLVE